MKLLIDQNVILDYLEGRAPLTDATENIIEDKRDFANSPVPVLPPMNS